MLRPLLLTALLAVSPLVGHSMVTERYDHEQDCTRYAIVNKERNSAGVLVLERELLANETIVDDRVHYGLSTQNLKVDFDERVARMEIISHVTLGRNQNLAGKDVLVELEADHPKFDQILNTLNRRLFLFSEVCLRDGKIVDVTLE